MTPEGDLVQEPTVTNPVTMALYDRKCESVSESLEILISDLPDPLMMFASFARCITNSRQRKRFATESVIEFEDEVKTGSMFPTGCSSNGDGEDVDIDAVNEYDDTNLGVALGITTPNWVTFGEVAPRRIDQDKSSYNTDIIRFEEFMKFLKMAQNNGLLCDENFIEPIFAADSDQVIARRLVVVVKGTSPSLMEIFDNDEEDDSEDGDDVDVDGGDGVAAPRGANQQAGLQGGNGGNAEAEAEAGDGAAPEQGGEAAATSGRSDTRRNIVHRLKWAINYLWVRYLETGNTDTVYSGKVKDEKKGKQRYSRKGDAEPHSKRTALKKWGIIAESFGLCSEGSVVDAIMSSDTLCMQNIVHERQSPPPMFAASEIFGLVNCIMFDNLRQEQNTGNSNMAGSMDHIDNMTVYDPMQTNPLHYMQEAVDVRRLCRATQFPDMCKGITFPPLRRRYAERYLEVGVSTAVMCISPEHFLAKSWSNMCNPEDAYLEHLRNLKTKATGRKRKLDPLMAMMARGDAEDMGTIAQANRRIWARVAAGDDSVTAIPVPEARRNTNQIREILLPDGGDEEVAEMRKRYENPLSLVDKLRKSADVKNFLKNQEELDKHLSTAYAKGLEKVCTADLAELQTRIDSVERAAEYLSDSIIKQARTAARSNQLDILSKAQIAVLQDTLEMTPERYCMGEKGIDREISPWGNFLNDRILFWEEVEGVYTAHASLIVLDASKKSAWIPYLTMRTNILLQGAAQAGKDFMKNKIVKYSKEGIFQPCGKSTEASQCDFERPHSRGCVKEHSETPVCLDKKHPRHGQEIEDKKTQLTECCHKYEKCHRYIRSDGTEHQAPTNFLVYTDFAMWVNTNEDMSIVSGSGDVDMSLQAMLSRFKLFMQPKPNRSFGSLGDNRMYKSKKKGANNAVKMAEDKFRRNSLQNDLFHAQYSLLVELGTVPSVDFTVFESVSAEILRICDKKGVLITERMKQQAWNDAWCFAVDDWWFKFFMLKSGPFVEHDGAASENNTTSNRKQCRNVPIPLLVRHLRANPIVCSEECSLFAWQILQNSGAASQGVMNHVAMLIKHMVDNALTPDGLGNKKLDSQTPCQKVMQFFESPSVRRGASLDTGFGGMDLDVTEFETYEYLYIQIPEDSDSSGALSGATHLQKMCDMLARYNKRHNVMDKDHNAASMHTTIMHYAKLNETFSAVRYEFRMNNTVTGQPEHIFAHPDEMWACFSNNMAATEQIMECLGMEFPEDSDMVTRKRMVLHVFSEYCTFSQFAQALNTYRSRKQTRPSMFYAFYTQVRKLVEALWAADEQFIVRSSMVESRRESLFEDAAHEKGRYKSLLPMPTPVMFDWDIVNSEMLRTAGGMGKKDIYFDDGKLKPVAISYINALANNLGNRLRNGLDMGEDFDEDEAVCDPDSSNVSAIKATSSGENAQDPGLKLYNAKPLGLMEVVDHAGVVVAAAAACLVGFVTIKMDHMEGRLHL